MKKYIPLWVSLAITPFVFLLALASAGVGHGSYIPALVLLPWAVFVMILRGAMFHIQGDSPFDIILVAVALLQFPFYGFLLSFFDRKRLAVAVISIVHISALFLSLFSDAFFN